MNEYVDVDDFSVEELLENISENEILDYIFMLYGV